MFDMLLTPGAPFYALSVAGAMIAAAGLLRLEQTRLALAGVRSLPDRKGMSGRFILGHIAAAPLVAAVLLAMIAGGASGMLRLVLLTTALAIYLAVAWIIPRRPVVAAQRERHILRKLTPGFVSYVRVALSGGDSPARVLERYIRRPETKRAAMQAVVREALSLVHDQRLRPFEALRVVARARGAQELTDVAEALAQGEQAGGTGYDQALAAHERTLSIILEDEFKRTLKKRSMILLLFIAMSLVVGILGNLLWVMAGPVLMGQGGF
ncbi:MAG: hypothetical protein KatS3mg057_1645 [Herpetosiphonaceae bacterium]|nr:MAG: hypothetical protein KatS3mg057_1645 [Herpetosiphonaceae bacterium]